MFRDGDYNGRNKKALKTPLNADETCRPNRLPWVPVLEVISPVQSGNIFVDLYDELGFEDKVSWTIRVFPSGSAYCSLQQSYEMASGTWYKLEARDTESVRSVDFHNFDFFALHFDLEAYARRVCSAYSYDPGVIRQTGHHKLISSRAVSMAGHLRYLVPAYQEDSLEAKAKDEVVHFENVILAEEHGRLNRLRVAIQSLRRLGWSVCKTWLQKRSLTLGTPYWRTFFSCFCSACGVDSAVPI